uniref:lipid II:glycine glycyltransferase FemX n=2 Tax=Gelidibacter sp. TaxID=2018083 RepID=UPI00404B4961
MRSFIFTKEKSWVDQWDGYIKDHPKGSHLMLSDWLQSYINYGFEYELGLVIENQSIVGGCGIIIAKFSLFKFYIIPHGPIFNEDYENYLEEHLEQLKQRAKHIGSCYMQFSLPISSNKKIKKHVIQHEAKNSVLKLFKQGRQFSYIYSSYGLNWVDINGYKDAEAFLETLTPKVRRNIRLPYNKKVKVSFATELHIIKKGYDVILENANYGNYSVRPFNEFKNTIIKLIEKNQAYFIICEFEGIIRASGFFVVSNGFITNITGGVLRDKPDLKLGYMLQWEMIKKSFEHQFEGYNISMGGSLGVQDFKSKFGAEAVKYENPHYYLILIPFYYHFYKFFNTRLKPYKHKVAKLLSQFKG